MYNDKQNEILLKESVEGNEENSLEKDVMDDSVRTTVSD